MVGQRYTADDRTGERAQWCGKKTLWLGEVMMGDTSVVEFITRSLVDLKEGVVRLETVLRDELREQKQEQRSVWERQWKENDNIWSAVGELRAKVSRAEGGVIAGRLFLVGGGGLVGFLITLSLKLFWG